MKISTIIKRLLLVCCLLCACQSAYAYDSHDTITMTRAQFLELKQLSAQQNQQLATLESKLSQLETLSTAQKEQMQKAQTSLTNANQSLTVAETQLTESQTYLQTLSKQIKADKQREKRYKIAIAVLAVALIAK